MTEHTYSSNTELDALIRSYLDATGGGDDADEARAARIIDSVPAEHYSEFKDAIVRIDHEAIFTPRQLSERSRENLVTRGATDAEINMIAGIVETTLADHLVNAMAIAEMDEQDVAERLVEEFELPAEGTGRVKLAVRNLIEDKNSQAKRFDERALAALARIIDTSYQLLMELSDRVTVAPAPAAAYGAGDDAVELVREGDDASEVSKVDQLFWRSLPDDV